MFTRRKKTQPEVGFGVPVPPSPEDVKARKKNAHQSLFFGRSKSEANANALSTDDFESLRKKLNQQHDDITTTEISRTTSSTGLDPNVFSRESNIKTKTILQQKTPEWGPSSPPTSSPLDEDDESSKNVQEIQDLKREIASMLENLDYEYGESPATPSSLRDLDDEHEDIINRKQSFVVGVDTSPPQIESSSPPISSSVPLHARIRSVSALPERKNSVDSVLSPTSSARKRGFGSVVGGFRKSIMMRRQSVFHGGDSPPHSDDYSYSPESPRSRSVYEQRYEQYKNYASDMIVEDEKKRLKELRQFSPQLVLHGFYREGKLNEMYFRMDVFYEKKENTLVSFAKALNK
jgi:DNA-binding transcriptional regulator YiaG